MVHKIFNRSTGSGDFDFIGYAGKVTRSKDFLVVYCTADKQTVDARLKEHNETCPYNYEKAQKLYRDNVQKFYKPEKTLVLDTTKLSVRECVESIIKKLKEVQKIEL